MDAQIIAAFIFAGAALVAIILPLLERYYLRRKAAKKRGSKTKIFLPKGWDNFPQPDSVNTTKSNENNTRYIIYQIILIVILALGVVLVSGIIRPNDIYWEKIIRRPHYVGGMAVDGFRIVNNSTRKIEDVSFRFEIYTGRSEVILRSPNQADVEVPSSIERFDIVTISTYEPETKLIDLDKHSGRSHHDILATCRSLNRSCYIEVLVLGGKPNLGDVRNIRLKVDGRLYPFIEERSFIYQSNPFKLIMTLLVVSAYFVSFYNMRFPKKRSGIK